MMFTLTESAAKHVQAMLARHASAKALRVGVKPSGCTGFGYVVDYAEAIDAADMVFEQYGVKVVVDQKSLPFLNNIEIDFIRDGLNQRFDFRNPNATATCGCGESFAV